MVLFLASAVAYLPVLDGYFHLRYDSFLLCETVLMLLMSTCHDADVYFQIS